MPARLVFRRRMRNAEDMGKDQKTSAKRVSVQLSQEHLDAIAAIQLEERIRGHNLNQSDVIRQAILVAYQKLCPLPDNPF